MKRLIKILIFLLIASSSFGQVKYRLLRKNPKSVRISELSSKTVNLCVYKRLKYLVAAIDGKVVWWELTHGTQVNTFDDDVEDAHEGITVDSHSDITSPGANIEDAVTKKHTQNSDTVLMSNTTDTLICGGNLRDTLTVDNLILIDGRDISVDGAKLDGIEENADVTDSANVSDALSKIPFCDYDEDWKGATELYSIAAQPATATDLGVGRAWEFADNADNSIGCDFGLPEDLADTSDVFIILLWSSPATSDSARWEIDYAIVAEDDTTDGSGVNSGQSIGPSATANGLVSTSFTIDNSEFSDGDDLIILRITRNHDHADDELGDVAHLKAVGIKFKRENWGIP